MRTAGERRAGGAESRVGVVQQLGRLLIRGRADHRDGAQLEGLAKDGLANLRGRHDALVAGLKVESAIVEAKVNRALADVFDEHAAAFSHVQEGYS